MASLEVLCLGAFALKKKKKKISFFILFFFFTVQVLGVCIMASRLVFMGVLSVQMSGSLFLETSLGFFLFVRFVLLQCVSFGLIYLILLLSSLRSLFVFFFFLPACFLRRDRKWAGLSGTGEELRGDEKEETVIRV